MNEIHIYIDEEERYCRILQQKIERARERFRKKGKIVSETKNMCIQETRSFCCNGG